MKIISYKSTFNSTLVLLAVGALLCLRFEGGLQAAESADILGEVDGEAISAQAVEGPLAVELTELQQQIYEAKRKKLDELIGEALLKREAAKRGASVEKLLDEEVKAKAAGVTDQDVENFYRENKARLKGDEKALAGKIRGYLQSQKLQARRDQFIEELRSQHRVVVHLKPPPAIRIAVPAREGAPVRGPADAPVTIIEFSDFQCPFCRQSVGVVKNVLTAYPKEVKLIFRNFPLENIHPQAREAAEAAECAAAQGRFWEYHDRLFAETDLSVANLKTTAEKLGLNFPNFEQCLSEQSFNTKIAGDLETGLNIGVRATPTFFINGRPLLGAQPFDRFKEIIEEEISAAGAEKR